MSEKWLERIESSLMNDPFAEGVNMVRYGVRAITVDGIYRTRAEDPNAAPMVSIRSITSDQVGSWRHMHDGYPIDDQHFIKYNCVASTTPDTESWFYCDSSFHPDYE